MTNLLDLITFEEYDMMSHYRDWYGWSIERSKDCEPISIRELLANPWATQKQDLYKMLGNTLMTSKEFSYEKDIETLKDEIIVMMNYRSSFGRAEREGWKFADKLTIAIGDAYSLPNGFLNDDWEVEYKTEEDKEIAEKHTRIRTGIETLISCTTLAKNVYEGEEFSFTLKNGKEYKVRNGCKPMRALAKLADTYDLTEIFEDFRICHSLIHNQKKLKGDITLSIHPLDYWTMSDNDCDWESCMNWMENGGYRQGTIEMMNSPSVVVAYMNSESPMRISNGEWSNKKWRQLFIVDKDVILGIKAYPYYNKELTNAIAKWIKELAEKNMGWSYFGNDDEPFDYYNGAQYYNPKEPSNLPYEFYFTSDKMYTDVGSAKTHPLYISTEKITRAYESKGRMVVEYNYSGASQCISCGVTHPDLSGESFLCCNDCEDIISCCHCGEIIYDGDGYYVNGVYYCEYCYQDTFTRCFCCENDIPNNDMLTIELHIPVSDEYIADTYPSFKKTQVKLMFSEEIEICPECIEEFERVYLKENCKVQIDCGRHYISIADINLDTVGDWCFSMPYRFRDYVETAQKTGDYDTLAKHYNYNTYLWHKDRI